MREILNEHKISVYDDQRTHRKRLWRLLEYPPRVHLWKIGAPKSWRLSKLKFKQRPSDHENDVDVGNRQGAAIDVVAVREHIKLQNVKERLEFAQRARTKSRMVWPRDVL